MPFFQNTYVQIILSTAAVYLCIVVGIRLFGKSELSQLSVVDLVFILLISNAVQNAMVGSDSTLAGGLIAAATLFLFNFVFKRLILRFPGFARLVQGEALMLVYKGKLNRANFAKSRLAMQELMEAVREHGVSEIAEVDLAVLEVDGNISVISKDFSHASVKRVRAPRARTKNEN